MDLQYSRQHLSESHKRKRTESELAPCTKILFEEADCYLVTNTCVKNGTRIRTFLRHTYLHLKKHESVFACWINAEEGTSDPPDEHVSLVHKLPGGRCLRTHVDAYNEFQTSFGPLKDTECQTSAHHLLTSLRLVGAIAKFFGGLMFDDCFMRNEAFGSRFLAREIMESCYFSIDASGSVDLKMVPAIDCLLKGYHSSASKMRKDELYLPVLERALLRVMRQVMRLQKNSRPRFISNEPMEKVCLYQYTRFVDILCSSPILHDFDDAEQTRMLFEEFLEYIRISAEQLITFFTAKKSWPEIGFRIPTLITKNLYKFECVTCNIETRNDHAALESMLDNATAASVIMAPMTTSCANIMTPGDLFNSGGCFFLTLDLKPSTDIDVSPCLRVQAVYATTVTIPSNLSYTISDKYAFEPATVVENLEKLLQILARMADKDVDNLHAGATILSPSEILNINRIKIRPMDALNRLKLVTNCSPYGPLVDMLPVLNPKTRLAWEFLLTMMLLQDELNSHCSQFHLDNVPISTRSDAIARFVSLQGDSKNYRLHLADVMNGDLFVLIAYVFDTHASVDIQALASSRLTKQYLASLSNSMCRLDLIPIIDSRADFFETNMESRWHDIIDVPLNVDASCRTAMGKESCMKMFKDLYGIVRHISTGLHPMQTRIHVSFVHPGDSAEEGAGKGVLVEYVNLLMAKANHCKLFKEQNLPDYVWISLGFLLRYCDRMQIPFYVDLRPSFYKLWHAEPLQFTDCLLDKPHLVNMLDFSMNNNQEALDLVDWDFAQDIFDIAEQHPVKVSSAVQYVCLKALQEEAELYPSRVLTCVRYGAAMGGYTSHRSALYLWQKFSRMQRTTFQQIIRMLRPFSMRGDVVVHGTDCALSRHCCLKQFRYLCPMAALGNYLSTLPEDRMCRFLLFATCSLVLQDHIRIMVQQSHERLIPVATTCRRLLILTELIVEDERSQNEAEEQLIFNKFLNLAIDQPFTFSVA